jgi:hypothetical protein
VGLFRSTKLVNRAYYGRMHDANGSIADAAHTHELAFESFGVRVALSTNDREVLTRVGEFIPPLARPCDPATAQHRFNLVTRDGNGYELQLNEEMIMEYRALGLALHLLEMHMFGYIAVHAPERIFVHAGAVAHRGRLIVVPGGSFSGKSTLVGALLRAGATYYSDEFAVFDKTGRVHPYPRPLSLRSQGDDGTPHTPESLGASTGKEPVAPSLILLTNYRPGAEWRPRRLSSGEAVLGILSNTVPAQERPEESLAAITRAVNGAVVLESDRGEADALAPLLLAELDS